MTCSYEGGQQCKAAQVEKIAYPLHGPRRARHLPVCTLVQRIGDFFNFDRLALVSTFILAPNIQWHLFPEVPQHFEPKNSKLISELAYFPRQI